MQKYKNKILSKMKDMIDLRIFQNTCTKVQKLHGACSYAITFVWLLLSNTAVFRTIYFFVL